MLLIARMVTPNVVMKPNNLLRRQARRFFAWESLKWGRGERGGGALVRA